MKLILAEKFSVAKDIAKAIGNFTQKDGYIETKEYLITWAMGHLLKIEEKTAPQKWTLENLPILPERFRYEPSDIRAQKQLKVIKDLLSRVQEVQIWTDPGREGELIARLILSFCGWKGKTLRMWTSEALTKPVVLRELRSLKPSEEFDSLYYSALARQHADWIVGINLTRGTTLRAKDKEVWSVGRVQTPTLALIVERDKRIEDFKPEVYYVIRALFSKDGKTYEATLLFEKKNSEGEASDKIEEKFNQEEEEHNNEDFSFRLSEKEAEEVFNKIKSKEGNIKDIKVQTHKELPRKLFSLSSLQRHANVEYGWTAIKTLEIAQSLYEKGYISYPRSDAEYLGEGNKDLAKQVLRALGKPELIPAVDKVGKLVFDNSKLTDHHAIIPLMNGEGLSGDEKVLFDAIAKRFIASFMPEYEYKTIEVWTGIDGFVFYTKDREDLSLGWKSLYQSELKKTTLPQLKKGDMVLLEKLWKEKRLTKPPPRYTEATLIKAMEKFGLGTPSTRASIIETLKERAYIKVKGKSLISTLKGRELIEKLKESKVSDVNLTSEWEKKLESIYREKKNYGGYLDFIKDIKEFVSKEVETLKNKTFQRKEEVIGKCELCGGEVVERQKTYQCKSCGVYVWKEVFRKKLTPAQALKLMSGKEVLVRGLKGKKPFSAYLKLVKGKVEIVKFHNSA